MTQTAANRRDGTGRLLGAKRALLVLTSCALALLLAEWTVRAFGLAPAVYPIRLSTGKSAYRRSANPILGYEFKAGYRDPAADSHESFRRTNSHGQRDLERSVRKPPGVRRILLLGDSVVAGHGIGDLNDTISRQLESLLAGQNVEVLNFGVGGYCTRAEVELLRTKGLAFQPDLVILLFVANDYVDYNTQVAQYRNPPPGWAQTLIVRSHLFRLGAVVLNFDGDWCTNVVEENRKAVGGDNVAAGIRTLRELSKDHGFQTLIAIWPEFEHDAISDAYSAELLRQARRQRLTVFSLANSFRDHLRSRPLPVSPRNYYTVGDTMHPSVEGAGVAAEALAEYLDEHPDVLAVERPGGQSETAGDINFNHE